MLGYKRWIEPGITPKLSLNADQTHNTCWTGVIQAQHWSQRKQQAVKLSNHLAAGDFVAQVGQHEGQVPCSRDALSQPHYLLT